MGKKNKKRTDFSTDNRKIRDDRFAALSGLFSENEPTEQLKKDCPEPNLQPDCPDTDCSESSSKNAATTWAIAKTRKGNFDIRLEKRGNRWVTVVSRLSGDIKSLLKQLRKLCASGGAVKADTVEIQGNHKETIDRYLKKPV